MCVLTTYTACNMITAISTRKRDRDVLLGHSLEDWRALPQGFSEVTGKVTLKLHVWQAQNEGRMF